MDLDSRPEYQEKLNGKELGGLRLLSLVSWFTLRYGLFGLRVKLSLILIAVALLNAGESRISECAVGSASVIGFNFDPEPEDPWGAGYYNVSKGNIFISSIKTHQKIRGSQMPECMWGYLLAIPVEYANKDIMIRQYDASPHPYWLPNFLNMPAVCGCKKVRACSVCAIFDFVPPIYFWEKMASVLCLGKMTIVLGSGRDGGGWGGGRECVRTTRSAWGASRAVGGGTFGRSVDRPARSLRPHREEAKASELIDARWA
ncbi:hypothetical protein K438DRAFT_1753357 [Mycena galopus ATCC 62051]|nr:hypothetical protein K438DRAFT_1753357 [Mycena galopus ATCC 62051]